MTDIKIERTFDAPIAKVWDAWADGTKMRQWSCPEGFEITIYSGEFKFGSEYSLTMKSQFYSGTIMGKYLEFSEPNKLVMTHYWDNEDGTFTVETTVTVILEEIDSKTKMTFTQTGFENTERADSHKDGWSQCFNKLSVFLT